MSVFSVPLAFTTRETRSSSPKAGPAFLRPHASSSGGGLERQPRSDARGTLGAEGGRRAEAARPEKEELGLEGLLEFLPLWLPVLAGLWERILASGVCRDAGAGGAEGGGPPPGAAQCGGSFQPVSGQRGAA